MYLGKYIGMNVLEGCYYPMLYMTTFNEVQISTIPQEIALRASCILYNLLKTGYTAGDRMKKKKLFIMRPDLEGSLSARR